MEGAGAEREEIAVESVCAAVGEAGIRDLVARFYRQIPADPLLSPMYASSELAEAERRLADFLVFRTGGPDTYLSTRGHPRLRMRHAPFAVTSAARDRWVKLMDNALAECSFPSRVAAVLQDFLHQSATFLINRSE